MQSVMELLIHAMSLDTCLDTCLFDFANLHYICKASWMPSSKGPQFLFSSCKCKSHYIRTYLFAQMITLAAKDMLKGILQYLVLGTGSMELLFYPPPVLFLQK
jgi:hypothetical protein